MPTSPNRVALRHLEARSDPHSEARNVVKMALARIPKSLNAVLKRMSSPLKKQGLILDLQRSSIEWKIHSSDGLRLYFELFLSDAKRDDPKTRDQVEQAFRDEFDFWVSPRMLTDGWQVSFGDY